MEEPVSREKSKRRRGSRRRNANPKQRISRAAAPCDDIAAPPRQQLRSCHTDKLRQEPVLLLDNATPDVVLIDNDVRLLQRPGLGIIFDEYSRAVLGLAVINDWPESAVDNSHANLSEQGSQSHNKGRNYNALVERLFSTLRVLPDDASDADDLPHLLSSEIEET